MSQIAQPGGAIDRRADVVALIAQPHLAGVDPDPQPDRRQRRPLQIEGAGHRLSRAGKRDDEAVALTLLDGPDPAVGGDHLRQRLVQPCHSNGHLVGLGLPQARGALDVGQQQRHGSGRQFAHGQVAPVSFAHASQHAATQITEHQQNC
ncbi:hypothetical protein [Mycobacterium sp. 94-17]|uniref:hypothetical protein n=1 Tax=Mycobacterium sp. 94-17 TaxID=2986147 RepID=UPI003B6428C3